MNSKGKKIVAAVAVAAAVGSATVLMAENKLPESLAKNGFIKEYDLNKDGTVTEKEMNKVFEQRLKQKHPDLRPEEIEKAKASSRQKERFAELDKNKDGKIKGEEIPGRHTMTRDDYLARAAEGFDRMDTNKDGKLTADERDAVSKKIAKSRAAKKADAAKDDTSAE